MMMLLFVGGGSSLSGLVGQVLLANADALCAAAAPLIENEEINLYVKLSH